MKIEQDRKNPRLPYLIPAAGEHYQTATMHPDDFRAHLAWVLAKRMHNR